MESDGDHIAHDLISRNPPGDIPAAQPPHGAITSRAIYFASDDRG
jgi:hypothetical protein